MAFGKSNDPHGKLPPLGAVEAFVAVSQAGSFADAAARIGISPSALSRRLKTLEEHLGERLIVRSKARVQLTAAGDAYLKAANRALKMLATGKEDALQTEAETVSITLPQFFAEQFLAPNLANFEQANPNINLRIDTSPRLADLREDEFDLAIRYGTSDWPGLLTETVFITAGGPACGPALTDGLDLPKRVEALSRHTLLHFSQVPGQWERFFETAGAKGLKGKADRYFDDAGLLYAAACQGLGMALIDPELMRPMLDEGLLVQPIDIEVATGDGFHFVFAPDREKRKPVRQFCDWVLSLPKVVHLRKRQKTFGH